MSLTVHVAADLGNGKINTGLRFRDFPRAIEAVVGALEDLCTALMAEQGTPVRAFECVLALIMRPGASGPDKWQELSDTAQLFNGCQLYVIGAGSPPPERGVIPKVTRVADASNIAASLRTAGGFSPEPIPTRSFPSPPPTPAGGPEAAIAPSNIERESARQYLFEQLCHRSAAQGLSDGRSFPAQHLHGVLVQNEMFFQTDTFSEMTENRVVIDHREWQRMEQQFAPVLDVLYDRIAAKSSIRNASGEAEDRRKQADRLKAQLDDLAEEEARLLARQAHVRDTMAKARRQLANLDAREKASRDDRSKEWDVVQKYVGLKLKQNRLRREEVAVNHQLSLL